VVPWGSCQPETETEREKLFEKRSTPTNALMKELGPGFQTAHCVNTLRRALRKAAAVATADIFMRL